MGTGVQRSHPGPRAGEKNQILTPKDSRCRLRSQVRGAGNLHEKLGVHERSDLDKCAGRPVFPAVADPNRVDDGAVVHVGEVDQDAGDPRKVRVEMGENGLDVVEDLLRLPPGVSFPDDPAVLVDRDDPRDVEGIPRPHGVAVVADRGREHPFETNPPDAGNLSTPSATLINAPEHERF